ncbi:MAG TPA: hypothetical protein VGG74_27810 [Kofleriaceae bacterium]|jgi:hypothetical protein
MRAIAIVLTLAALARPAAAFDTWWHAEATRKACEATGFSADARLTMQVENYLTDVLAALDVVDDDVKGMLSKAGAPAVDPAYNYLHFDAVFTTKDVAHNWDQLQRNTLLTLKKYAKDASLTAEFRTIALLTVLGASLHVVQDFYSHSNWVNTWQPKGSVPLWQEIAPADRDKLDIHTGAYPDGSAPGHQNHADLNKDNSARPLNTEGVEAATRASIAWLKLLKDADPSLPWGEMQSYNIQNNVVMKNYLMHLDATFLTTSSIVKHHFDGDDPKKRVFSPNDPSADMRQAATMLTTVLGSYLTNLAQPANTFDLPSPYWVAHLHLHVSHDLAAGLMLAGKPYIKP